LKKRFSIDRCIFVADRGLVEDKNIDKIKELEYDYIFALRKRRLNEVKEIMEADLEKYEKLYEIKGNKKKLKLLYLEKIRDTGNDKIRYIICHNEDIAKEKEKELEEEIKKKKEKIEKIRQRYKDAGVILRHISKIEDIDRYFKYWIKGNGVEVKEKKENIEYEKIICGKWVLKTENFELKTEETIEVYKNLSEIERTFRTIKSFLDLRPIYHRDEYRVKGHIFVCVLAFYIQKIIEKYLDKAGIDLSGIEAIELFSRIKLIKSRINGELILQAIKLKKEHKEVLKALGIHHMPETFLVEKK
jgi:transposase